MIALQYLFEEDIMAKSSSITMSIFHDFTSQTMVSELDLVIKQLPSLVKANARILFACLCNI